MWRTLYLAAFVGVGTALLALALYARYHRPGPGVRWFATALIGSAIWCGLTLLGQVAHGDLFASALLSVESSQIRLWLQLLATGIAVLAIGAWTLFVIQYTGRTDLFTQPVRAAIGAGIGLLALLIITTGRHGLVVVVEPHTNVLTSVEGLSVVVVNGGPLLALVGITVASVLGLGAWLLVGLLWSPNQLFARQGLLLLVGSLTPILFALPRLLGWTSLPLVPIGLVLTCGCLVWALGTEELLRVTPAASYVGAQRAIDRLDDGVVITDTNGTVLRSNDTARALLGVEGVAGQQLETVLDSVGATPEQLPADVSRDGRHLMITASQVTDEAGRPIGTTITVRDVTNRRLRKQRLQVLNRIVRHNLRNDLGVVSGFASMLQENPDTDIKPVAERIEQTANSLVGLSEKARTIEQLFASPAQLGTVTLSNHLEQTADQLKSSYPDVRVQVRVDPDGPVVTDLLAIEEGLWALAENAAEYADSTEPTVELVGRSIGSEYELQVIDNGAGIPSAELEGLRAGAETPLEHGSGLGLWVAQWGARRLDGELSFECTDDGTTATIRAPCLEHRDGIDPTDGSLPSIDAPLLSLADTDVLDRTPTTDGGTPQNDNRSSPRTDKIR